MLNSRTSLHRLPVALALLFAVLFTLSCSRTVVDDSISQEARGYRPPANQPPSVDASANNFNITMLNGGSTRVPDLIGKNKVVLLNFWATWCGPCKREIPDLTELKRKFEGQDVEIIGLTVEEPELRNSVQAFVQQYSINYTVGFAPQEMFFIFNQANGNDRRAPIPQTFIFGRNGKLIDSVKGLRRDFRVWAEGAIGYALKNS
ncbi:MAG: TlpA disulfide reductase family protein [Blastocatellia bacterium]